MKSNVYHHLISFRKQLQNLPDKGAKIKTLHDRLQNELANKFSVDQAAALLEGLNIAAVGKKAMNDIEWNGTYRKTETVVLDSDDDEEPEDPLKIIACSTTVSKSKIIKVEKEIPLITEKDLEEIKSFRDEHVQTPSENDTSSLLEPHAVHMCAFDKFLEPNNRKKFLPHQTTISNVHAPEKVGYIYFKIYFTFIVNKCFILGKSTGFKASSLSWKTLGKHISNSTPA